MDLNQIMGRTFVIGYLIFIAVILSMFYAA